MYVNVDGGTNAGRRRPLRMAATDWKCPSCKAQNKYYWLKCPNCNHRRPA